MPQELNSTLMGCDDLMFYAPQDTGTANYITRMPGTEWHLYGDTRWPSQSTWIEFSLTNCGCPRFGGVLVVREEIPRDDTDPMEWAALNHPLAQLLPELRSESNIQTRADMLKSQESSGEVIAGPTDQNARYVQGYCIYRKADGENEVIFLASYTDILNRAGIPIPKYRMASYDPRDLTLCQFSLHALFRLNEARLAGTNLLEHHQLQTFSPLLMEGDAVPPKWTTFHPSRTLRTRPALRALPSPALFNGIISQSDYQDAMDVRHREANAHMLAFERLVRPRETGMALMNLDSNSSMAAFLHRANGGAIYVLPDRLVEEFDHTDCGEVRVSDLTLPFPSVFLKFNPPHPILLAENAHVDGCYIVKQGDEFLFTLTSRLDRVDYENSMSMACMDPTFSLHLPASDAEMSINNAVELGIEDFMSRNAPPEEDASTTIERPDGTISQVIDIRAESRKRRIEEFRSQESAFRSCLNIIVNAACFIAFRPDDISEAWAGQPAEDVIAAANAAGDTRRSRDRKIGALQKIENGDFTRIKICGRDLFSDDSRSNVEGHGKSPRAHWRRGHWRRQRHGVGLALVVLKWIRPTIVKKENGPLVESRIYEV